MREPSRPGLADVRPAPGVRFRAQPRPGRTGHTWNGPSPPRRPTSPSSPRWSRALRRSNRARLFDGYLAGTRLDLTPPEPPHEDRLGTPRRDRHDDPAERAVQTEPGLAPPGRAAPHPFHNTCRIIATTETRLPPPRTAEATAANPRESGPTPRDFRQTPSNTPPQPSPRSNKGAASPLMDGARLAAQTPATQPGIVQPLPNASIKTVTVVKITLKPRRPWERAGPRTATVPRMGQAGRR